MSTIKKFFSRFDKTCETSESHPDANIQTHYYKGSFDKVFSTVSEILESTQNYKVKAISKDHGEVALNVIHKDLKAFMVVTVITVKPINTAVDVMISSQSGSITGINPRLKQEIVSIYKKLDQRLQYIGSGKNA